MRCWALKGCYYAEEDLCCLVGSEERYRGEEDMDEDYLSKTESGMVCVWILLADQSNLTLPSFTSHHIVYPAFCALPVIFSA